MADSDWTPNGAPAAHADGGLSRRKALSFAVFATTALLMACGGSDDPEQTEDSAGAAPGPAPAPAPSPAPTPSPSPAPSPSPSPAPAPAPWSVGSIRFTAGSATSFDLAATLPAGVARGGVFGISSSGASLPSGMALTGAGILSSGSATVGEVVGVVFTYSLP